MEDKEKEFLEKYLNNEKGAKDDFGDYEKSYKENEEKYSKSNALKDVLGYIPLLFSLVKDYFTDNLPKGFEVSWTTIASIIGALAYLVSPVDVIPDFIPGLGLVDDAGVLAILIASIKDLLDEYKAKK